MGRCALLLWAALAAGCASPGGGGAPVRAIWVPSAQEWKTAATQGSITLYRQDKSVSRVLPGDLMKRLLGAKTRIDAVAPVRAKLAIVETGQANAFAFHYQGRPIVAFSIPWLDRLGHDEDAIAAVMGHELAHLHLGHSAAERRRREQSAKESGQVAGVLLGLIGVPFGGTIAGNAATAYARSFSRDEERAADELGIAWAKQARYDPCGMFRVIRMFESLSAGSGVPWLSTHPGHEERAQAAVSAKGSECLP